MAHIRSRSMPSRPQPLIVDAEEELHKLSTCLASTSSATPQTICNRLRDLGIMYENIEMVLQLPSNQQALSRNRQKKWVEKELDQSIKVLDLCTIMRDNLVAMKEHAQDLALALRRNDSVPESKLQAYTRSQKKAKKEIKNCLRSLKQANNKLTSTLDKETGVLMVLRMLIEARDITMSLMLAIFSSYNKSKAEPMVSRWSFVSKTLHKTKVAHEDVLEYQNEVERLEHLETGLDCLIRRLVLNRVSLLNILSL